MTSLEYSPKDSGPRPRSAVVRFLFRTNPFYLLSAMCMLAGCLALTNSLSWTSIPIERLLAHFFAARGVCLGWRMLRASGCRDDKGGRPLRRGRPLYCRPRCDDFGVTRCRVSRYSLSDPASFTSLSS